MTTLGITCGSNATQDTSTFPVTCKCNPGTELSSDGVNCVRRVTMVRRQARMNGVVEIKPGESMVDIARFFGLGSVNDLNSLARANKHRKIEQHGKRLYIMGLSGGDFLAVPKSWRRLGDDDEGNSGGDDGGDTGGGDTGGGDTGGGSSGSSDDGSSDNGSSDNGGGDSGDDNGSDNGSGDNTSGDAANGFHVCPDGYTWVWAEFGCVADTKVDTAIPNYPTGASIMPAAGCPKGTWEGADSNGNHYCAPAADGPGSDHTGSGGDSTDTSTDTNPPNGSNTKPPSGGDKKPAPSGGDKTPPPSGGDKAPAKPADNTMRNVLIGVAVLAAIGGIAYVATKPKTPEEGGAATPELPPGEMTLRLQATTTQRSTKETSHDHRT